MVVMACGGEGGGGGGRWGSHRHGGGGDSRNVALGAAASRQGGRTVPAATTAQGPLQLMGSWPIRPQTYTRGPFGPMNLSHEYGLVSAVASVYLVPYG